MNKARIISDFLMVLARHVESLTDAEVNEILNDKSLRRIFTQKPKLQVKKPEEPAEVHLKAEALMKDLTNKSSREEAVEFLDQLAPNKSVLIEAAKIREVHIVKQDTLKTISDKLIENVVGSRLDSARIRGG